MDRNYTTQMDAARKGIVTPELETVARKEQMRWRSCCPWWPAARWPSPPTA